MSSNDGDYTGEVLSYGYDYGAASGRGEGSIERGIIKPMAAGAASWDYLQALPKLFTPRVNTSSGASVAEFSFTGLNIFVHGIKVFFSEDLQGVRPLGQRGNNNFTGWNSRTFFNPGSGVKFRSGSEFPPVAPQTIVDFGFGTLGNLWGVLDNPLMDLGGWVDEGVSVMRLAGGYIPVGRRLKNFDTDKGQLQLVSTTGSIAYMGGIAVYSVLD